MLRQLLVTFFACALFSATTYAQQTVVLVNSPANIEGSYVFTNAWDNAWGVDLATGVWTEDAIITISDGTTAATNLGCDSIINVTELTGKIAIVDRGACNFSLKALNAQKAGAIACVIVNNGGAPVGMGAGTFGPDVTIPTVMISTEDGANIKDEIGMGPVNMTIGTLTFPNDIGAANGDVLRNPNGVIPAVQATGTNASFQPGAIITNNGENDATNVVLSTSIDFTPAGGGSPTNVYTEATTLDLLEVDSAYLIGPDNLYDVASGAGTYNVTYDITADADDEFTLDNTITTSFILSDNVYCKGGWDAANSRPARTGTSYTIGGGGSVEFLAGFKVPLGSGYKIDSLEVYITTNAANLGVVGASNITPYVYEWDDVNADGAVANDEITVVAIGQQEEFEDPMATAAWLKIEMLDFETLEPGGYIIPDNDKTYFMGVRYQGSETVFFGFDENYDQNVYFNNIAPTLADLSYFIVNVWDGIKPDIENDAGTFTDLYGSVAMAMYIDQLNSTGENNPEIGSFEVYPNPTTDFVNVETSFAKNFDKVDYTIVSRDGSVVSVISRDVKGNADYVSIEVSHLPSGQYFLNVNTVDGSISKAFTVQH